jgi:uncharacterized protein YjfI (DUF2170 family)
LTPFAAPPALAADIEVALAIKDHRFTPDYLKVPAHTKIKLIITNQDATPEEFESYELKREKFIPANSKGILFVGPLAPGRYEFFGEFNQKTARGVIVAE